MAKMASARDCHVMFCVINYVALHGPGGRDRDGWVVGGGRSG